MSNWLLFVGIIASQYNEGGKDVKERELVFMCIVSGGDILFIESLTLSTCEFT
jgi:hypothetical protein